MEYNIYIDYDQMENIDTLKKRVIVYMEQTYKAFPEVLIKKIWWRLSSKRGIHLKLEVEVSMSDELILFCKYLTIRAIWRDDSTRIAMDLIRYQQGGINKTNRIFTIKQTKGETYATSQWKPLFSR